MINRISNHMGAALVALLYAVASFLSWNLYTDELPTTDRIGISILTPLILIVAPGFSYLICYLTFITLKEMYNDMQR